MYLNLAPWEWATQEDMSFWRAPGGNATGCLDMRSLPQCGKPGPTAEGYGIFAYETDPGSIGYKLGDLGSLVKTPMKNSLKAAFGLGENIVADTPEGIIAEVYNHHADPTGLLRWKPIRGSLRKGSKITLAGKTIWLSKLTANILSNTVAVFQADYRRNKAVPDTLSGLDKEVWIQGFRTKEERASDTRLTEVQARERWDDVLRRWTGSETKKLFGKMSDELSAQILPPEYAGDKWRVPKTVIGDTFVEAAGDVALNLHTATGPNGGFSWTHVDGEATVLAASDDLKGPIVAATGNPSSFRAELPLSSDEHYVKVGAVFFQLSTSYAGVMLRFSPSAETGILLWARNTASYGHFIGKVVNGTLSELIKDAIAGGSPPWIIKGDVDSADLITLYMDGSPYFTSTDTTGSGNLYTGLALSNAITQWSRVDNFEAGDLGGVTFVPRVMIF